MKNKIRFNIYGLLLFLIIMMPNLVWFFIPSKNDILRNETITPIIDTIASIFQVLMVLCLCFRNKKYDYKYDLLFLICVAFYFVCWILYYCTIANGAVILGLIVFPCLSFIFYEIKIKHWIALVPTIIFSLLHLSSGIMNHIIVN